MMWHLNSANILPIMLKNTMNDISRENQRSDDSGGISNANPINYCNKHQQNNNDNDDEEDPSTLSWSFR